MNSTIYRKIVLVENWNNNQVIMVKKKVNVPRCLPCPYSINFQRMHPMVLTEEAYWISHNELCIGYHSTTNPDIFRPVFSYKRQGLLDKVHGNRKEDKCDDDENDYSIIKPNLRYARKKYLFGFVRKKELPMDCVKIILSFINNNL
jgi:hypothetical protein